MRYSKAVLIYMYHFIYLGREREHYKRCTRHFQPAQNLPMPMHEQYLKDIFHDLLIYRSTSEGFRFIKPADEMKTLNLHKLIKQLNIKGN